MFIKEFDENFLNKYGFQHWGKYDKLKSIVHEFVRDDGDH